MEEKEKNRFEQKKYFRVVNRAFFYSTEMGEYKNKLLKAIEKHAKRAMSTCTSHSFYIPKNVNAEEIENFIAYLYYNSVTKTIKALNGEKLKGEELIERLKEICPMKYELEYVTKSNNDVIKDRNDVYDILNTTFVYFAQRTLIKYGLNFGYGIDGVPEEDCLTLVLVSPKSKKAAKKGMVEEYRSWTENFNIDKAMETKLKLEELKQEKEASKKKTDADELTR